MWSLSTTAAAGLLLARCALCVDGLNSMANLVQFGDSYTDEGRLGYFINNGGEAPPAGALLPESSATASGGTVWGRFIAQKSGAKLLNYAVGGATCSNDIVERDFSLIGQPFPSIKEYEVPAYEADLKFQEDLYAGGAMRADNTVFAVWIGTNDLGAGAILTDANARGSTISTYVDCVWGTFDSVYETGGRHFVLLNNAPLELSPIYNVPELGGTMDSQFWANKTAYNMTEYKFKMLEYSTSANTMFEYGLPFMSVVEKRWPGATVQLFDVHSLMKDIIETPDEYLSAPANVTGYYNVCNPTDNSQCVKSGNDMSSFFWFDELHPSERIDELIADEFIKVVAAESKYGKTYSA